ncbi:MAG: hypothetical protein U0821_08740 [Chloroflexota bacterium]
MTPDRICGEAGERPSVRLELRVIPAGKDWDEVPTVDLTGSREALRFLARVIQAVADTPDLPATFHLSPKGAGNYHFSSLSNAGIYIEYIDPER